MMGQALGFLVIVPEVVANEQPLTAVLNRVR
jgi:hypothetical protein